MSTQPALPLQNAALPEGYAPASKRKVAVTGVTINGVLLFLIALSVFASGSMSTRLMLFGLAVHPYLLPVGVAFPLVVLSRISEFPMRILAPLSIFTLIYCFSVLNGGGVSLNEILKMVAAPVTMITFALLVRRRGDFVAGTLGLTIAVAMLAIPALGSEQSPTGIKVMDVANKNSYSLYALPVILLSGYVALNLKLPVILKSVLVGASGICIVAIFMTGNRSGYLGVVLVGLLLLWNRKAKGMLLVGAMAMIVVYYLLNFGSTETFEYRLQQTTEGNSSDTKRYQLVLVCLQIGLENPLIGVGPQVLPFEIAKQRTAGYQGGAGEAHNVYAHIIGGSGFICFAALGLLCWGLCSWRLDDDVGIDRREDPLRNARRLMWMLVILWAVRALFTAEILFNPSFNMAIGMVIGYCVLAQKARDNLKSSKPAIRPGQMALAPGH